MIDLQRRFTTVPDDFKLMRPRFLFLLKLKASMLKTNARLFPT
jgi:hypothetical protein